ncbi:MAG: hypothetical protein OXI67_06245 [Candidatus Poribacteria bacterium]|nr:hypothetical protein [Candidatus Poribacteria bacterium]MDE0482158.1 hypothetical protein [Candidatus Poribacteria bacterium]
MLYQYPLLLCQHIIVGRDSEIAPTDELLMVGGNSGECPNGIHTVDFLIWIPDYFQIHQLAFDKTLGSFN